MLASERKGHILPVHLEPTTIPLSLKYPLAGIQHIEFYQGDPDDNLKAILRSLERPGRDDRAAAARSSASARRGPARAGQPARTRRTAPTPHAERGAVAVLPFDNISPDQETDYFSDGLTEELIARLSLVSEIELISRWASMQYKGAEQDIRAIGHELGARYIVGGGVRRFQDSVRITVQLVDVVTNLQLWGNTYKGKLDDIFDIQEQVAQQIVEALKLKLTFSEKALADQAPDAQRGGLRPVPARPGLAVSADQAQRRVRDPAVREGHRARPALCAAYAGCSSAYGQMYQLIAREERYRELAQEFSFKALMYDNNLPEAYRAMGLSYFLWGKLERGHRLVHQGDRDRPRRLHRALDARPDLLHRGQARAGARALPAGRRDQAELLCRAPATSRRPAWASGATRKPTRSIAACSRSCRTTCCRIPTTRGRG